jgi:hypothetical protein
VVVHICNPSALRKLREEEFEFKTSLGLEPKESREILSQKKKKRKE